MRPDPLPELDEPVDAVYTWVDGSDPAFRASFQRHSPTRPEGEATARGDSNDRDNRFRDNGELRHSLRSLAAHAPWVRRIHLLTNGQVPNWLDRSDPRIHLVRHDEVFEDPGALPTFNSNAIEMNLHRIPGLARRFLYFNDDVFLGRPVRKADFFPPGGGERVLLEDFPLTAALCQGSAHDRSLAHTVELLDRLWGPPRLPRLLPAHAPQAYDRDRIRELETLLPGEFRETAAHRFRSGNDLVLAALYAHSAWEDPSVAGRHERVILPDPRWSYRFVMLENRPWTILRAFTGIRLRRPTFFGINDDLGDISALHPLLLALRAFLFLQNPRRGPFERRFRR